MTDSTTPPGEISFCLLADETDKDPKPASLPWENLAELLTTHERRTPNMGKRPGSKVVEDLSKFGTAWIPVTYASGARGNQNVQSINVASFDLDGWPYKDPETGRLKSRPLTPAEWGDVMARVEASGYAAAVHSSYSYSPDKPKGRVVFRVSRPMLPAEWPIVRAHLIEKLNLPADPATKDLTRLYYLPAAPEGAPVFAGVTDGTQSVDVAEIVKGHRVEALTTAVQSIAADRHAAAMAAAQAAEQMPVDLDQIRTFLRVAEGNNASMIKKALKGESFAEQGNRDNALNALCAAARFALPPNTPSAAIVEVFRESIQSLPNADGQDWLAEAKRKLDRHQERRILHDSARQAQQEEQFARLRAEAARSALVPPKRAQTAQTDTPGASEPDDPIAQQILALRATGPYAEADVAQWAQEQGCADVIDFQRRWIVTHGEAHYVFVEGRYLPPVPTSNLEHSIKRDLARAPVELTHTDGKGNVRMRDLKSIRHDYSTIARRTQADLALQRSHYEPIDQCFHEATTPLRHLTPTEHPTVQRWLDLVDPSGKLTDWVASVPRLDRQLCAVYLDGPKGIGKTLLASGLARLWTTGGPSSLARILEGFNETIVQCPLILADEGLPQRKGITAEIRNLIGTTSRTLNRKFLPMTSLNGALRLVIAGNNDRLMETGEELSANDLEAVASRIYYIKANNDAAVYLNALGGPPVIQRWVSDDTVAEHALYLRNTRKVNEAARFLVEGDTSEFHRQLAMGSGVGGVVSEWLARYLADPNPGPSTHVLTGSGELWVNTEAMVKEPQWAKYVPASKVPTASQIARALRGISHAVAKVSGAGGKVTSYHVIEPSMILTFASRLQIGDPEAVRTKLQAPNDTITAHQMTRGLTP